MKEIKICRKRLSSSVQGPQAGRRRSTPPAPTCSRSSSRGDHRQEFHARHAAAGPAQPDHRGRKLSRHSRPAIRAYLASALKEDRRPYWMQSKQAAAEPRRQRPRTDGADAAAGRQLRHTHRHRRHRQSRFQEASVPALLRWKARRSESADGHRGHRGAGQLPGAAVGGSLQEQRRVAPVPCATGPCRVSATSRWW